MAPFRHLLPGLALLVPGCVLSSCFTRATGVRTRHGDVPIDRILPGDAVFSFDPQEKKLVERKVTRIWRHGARRFGSLPGTSLASVTDNHPIYDAGRDRFVRADAVTEGMQLLQLVGQTVTVAAALPFRAAEQPAEPVFNLTVSGTQTYFAGGLLVHNKTPMIPEDCSISPSRGELCEQGIANYLSRDYYEIVSPQAACLSFLGDGGAGGVGGRAGTNQPSGMVEGCPHDPGEISTLAVDAWLSAYQGDKGQTLCQESALFIESLSGPLTVEFYALDRDRCDADKTLLGSVYVTSSDQRVPFPDWEGSFEIRLVSETERAVHALVRLR